MKKTEAVQKLAYLLNRIYKISEDKRKIPTGLIEQTLEDFYESIVDEVITKLKGNDIITKSTLKNTLITNFELMKKYFVQKNNKMD